MIPSHTGYNDRSTIPLVLLFVCAIGMLMLGLTADAVAQVSCPTCAITYPFTSSNPRTSVVFNESEVLRKFNPDSASCATQGGTIKLWYNDEHALTLGVREVRVKTTSSHTDTTRYTVTAMGANPSVSINPLVGDTVTSGDQAGIDPSARPIFPSLFISDITSNSLNKSGDWQSGGKAIPPNAVFGTWKSAIKIVDKTKSPATSTITPDGDPSTNAWTLGAGSDIPPGGFSALKNEGYGAECRWSIDSLVAHGYLIVGHTYRLEFIVHDGDQNNSGGDCGEGCTSAYISPPPLSCSVSPAGQTICSGDSVILTVNPTGGLPPYTYLWSNGKTTPSIAAKTQGTFSVTVTDAAGPFQTTTNCNTTVTVDFLNITLNPRDTTVCDGGTVCFSAAASAVPAATLQWQVSTDNGATWSNLVGQTSSQLCFAANASQDGYKYRAAFTNFCGTKNTTAATLTVNTAPVVTLNPKDTTVCDGAQVCFSSTATGKPAPTVQWQVSTDNGTSWNNVPGATNATLCFTASLAQSGNLYRAVWSNVCAPNGVNSSAGKLTVNKAPVVTLQPADTATCAGSQACFSSTADATPPATLQWQVSTDGGATWTDLAGQTTSPLCFTTTLAQNGNKYRASFTNACGTTNSNAAILGVDNCGVSLVKTPDKTDIPNGVGSAVTYTYVVTNTASHFAFTGSVTDDNGTPGNTADDFTVCTVTNLAAGASQTCTSTRNLTGTTTNIANACGTEGGINVCGSDTATVTGHDRGIRIVKTASQSDVPNGSTTAVTYTYVVTNTGSFFNAAGCVVDDAGTPGNTADDVTVCCFLNLAPGASDTCHHTFNLTGTTTNIATVCDTSFGASVCGSDTVTVTGHGAGISLTKTPDKTDIPNGVSTPVTYTYVITNNSTFFTASGTLVDDNGTPGNTADDFTVCTWGPLAANGGSQTCTSTRNLTGTTTNIATATGTSGGAPVSAIDTATVTGHDRSIRIRKTASQSDVPNGSTTAVTYTYVVTNTGSFFNAAGCVVDDAGTPGNTADDVTVCCFLNLAPGASDTCHHTFNLTGTAKNLATVCDTSFGAPVCGTDTVTVHGHPVSISLTKTPNPTDIPNGVTTPVLYTYVITNTGAFFPASGTLVDDNGTPGNTADDFTVCTWGPIAPGANQTCTATLNLNLPGTDTLRTRTNKAIASGTSGGAPVKDSATATVRGHDRSISLTKTPDKKQIQAGVTTPVLFTYVVCNTGKYFPASGSLKDDNGTPSNTSDDVTVGTWGPLAPGACQTLTHTFNLSQTTKNVATATGTSGGSGVSAKDSAVVNAIQCGCTLGYPFTSSNPRTSVVFNESGVLRAFDPVSICAGVGSSIKMWYNDEHALTLGVRQVVVKTASGTTTTNFPLSATPVSPNRVNNPAVGDTITIGDLRGTDPSDRPDYPVLFLTDITTNANSTSGDWQFGGTGIAPTAVCGVWKGAVVTVNKTVNPATRTTTPDADPAKNNWVLGPGSDIPPGGFSAYSNEGYSAECIWSIDSLVARGLMVHGRTYRCEFIVHDGDQNKAGGDCGEGCTRAVIPASGNTAVAVERDGAAETASILPAEYALAQNYPNPFNPSTQLRFELPEASVVKLTVYNVLGQEVATLVNGVVEAGFRSVTWNTENSNGKSLASGVYLYRLNATSVKSGKQFTDFKKMVLIK